MRGGEHHVRYAGGALGPKDVVLDDEGTRFCGERSTTSGTPAALWTLKTWCLTTEEQGLAGGGAPRHRVGAPSGGRRPGNSKPLARAWCRVPRRQSLHFSRRPHHSAGPRGRRPFRSATAHQKRTDAQSVLLFFLFCLIHPAFQSIRLDQVSPTSPSGFSWSSSWIAASSGFWHVPARSGRSAVGPWNRTGSSNSCCGWGSAPH